MNISLISGNRELTENLAGLIKESVDFVTINNYQSESSFLETDDILKTDIIISDRTGELSDWRSFLRKTGEKNSDAQLIFITEDGQKDLTVEMIKENVYDILTPSSFGRIQPLLHQIVRDSDDRANLRYLSKEKDFNDYIANNSRSMLSIINKDYVYVKVNSTFCNAHNVEIESIIGKSLPEIWGQDTFKSKIQQNIDLCFAGNTIRYEANFNTPLFGDRYYEVVFRPISKGDSEITHLLAETFDITDLRLSQKIVNEMEEEFKKLKTNLPIGFLRCAPDGIIIHANMAFLKIMECDDEASMAGLNIQEFYTEKGLFGIHLNQLMNDRIKTFGRVPLYTVAGHEIACRISGFIVSDSSGEPSFIDFALEDSSRELMPYQVPFNYCHTDRQCASLCLHCLDGICHEIQKYSEKLGRVSINVGLKVLYTGINYYIRRFS